METLEVLCCINRIPQPTVFSYCKLNTLGVSVNCAIIIVGGIQIKKTGTKQIETLINECAEEILDFYF